MRVNQAQASKPAGAATQPPDVGKFEMGSVAQDDVADESVARKQNSDLASEFSGDRGDVLCQFRRDYLFRRDTSAEYAFQCAALGLFYS